MVPVTPWELSLTSSQFVESEFAAGRVRDVVRALAEETDAGTVVSGVMYLEADTLEIQVEVTDARIGRSLGAVDPVVGQRGAQRDLLERLQQGVLGFLSVNLDDRLAPTAHLTASVPTLEAYQDFKQGLELYLGRDYRDAIPHLRRAFERDSTWVQPLLFLGHCHRNLLKFAEADSVLGIMARFGESLSPYERARMEHMALANGGHFEEALVPIRQAAAMAPGSKAVYNYAITAVWVNRPQEALDALLTLNPGRGAMRGWYPYWIYVCEAHHMLGNYEQELDAIHEAHSYFPDRFRVPQLSYEARALASLGRVDDVLQVLDQLIAAPDVNENLWNLMLPVEMLIAFEHTDAAKQALHRVIRWFQDQPPEDAATQDHRYRYGIALFNADSVIDAREVFDVLVEDHPNNADDRGFRGFIAASQGDTGQAHADLDWLANLHNTLTSAHDRAYNIVLRAWIHGALGNPELAVQHFRQAYASGYPHRFWHWSTTESAPLRGYPAFEELIRPKG